MIFYQTFSKFLANLLFQMLHDAQQKEKSEVLRGKVHPLKIDSLSEE